MVILNAIRCGRLLPARFNAETIPLSGNTDLFLAEAAKGGMLDDIEYSKDTCGQTVSQTDKGERVVEKTCTLLENPDALNQLRNVLVHPRVVYFLIRKVEPYLFSMEDIRNSPQADCAATSK